MRRVLSLLMLVACTSDESNGPANTAGTGDTQAGRGGAQSGDQQRNNVNVSCEHKDAPKRDTFCITVDARRQPSFINDCYSHKEIASCPDEPHYGACEVVEYGSAPMTNTAGDTVIRQDFVLDRTTTRYVNVSSLDDDDEAEAREEIASTRDGCLNGNDDHAKGDAMFAHQSAKWLWADGYREEDFPEYVRPDSAGDHERGEINNSSVSGKELSLSCYNYGKDRCSSYYGLYDWQVVWFREQCNNPVEHSMSHSCPVNDSLRAKCESAVQNRVQVEYWYYSGSDGERRVRELAAQQLLDVARLACDEVKGKFEVNEAFSL